MNVSVEKIERNKQSKVIELPEESTVIELPAVPVKSDELESPKYESRELEEDNIVHSDDGELLAAIKQYKKEKPAKSHSANHFFGINSNKTSPMGRNLLYGTVIGLIGMAIF